MRALKITTVIIVLSCLVNGLALAQISGDIEYIRLHFEEVKSASPVVGSATLPLRLAGAFIKAIPEKYQNDAKEDGFDIPAILEMVKEMRESDTFELTVQDYHLKIDKYTENIQSAPTPRYFMLSSKEVNLPIPIVLTNTAVQIFQMAFEDLKVDPSALRNFISELKQTPPGLIVQGKDELIDNWLKVRLE